MTQKGNYRTLGTPRQRGRLSRAASAVTDLMFEEVPRLGVNKVGPVIETLFTSDEPRVVRTKLALLGLMTLGAVNFWPSCSSEDEGPQQDPQAIVDMAEDGTPLPASALPSVPEGTKGIVASFVVGTHKLQDTWRSVLVMAGTPPPQSDMPPVDYFPEFTKRRLELERQRQLRLQSLPLAGWPQHLQQPASRQPQRPQQQAFQPSQEPQQQQAAPYYDGNVAMGTYNAVAARAQFGPADIRALHPDLGMRLARVIQRLQQEEGWGEIVVFSGVRNETEQQRLYNLKRTPTLNTLHYCGRAADVGLKGIGWSGDLSNKDHKFWQDLARISQEEGLVSGRFFSQKDVAHVQLGRGICAPGTY